MCDDKKEDSIKDEILAQLPDNLAKKVQNDKTDTPKQLSKLEILEQLPEFMQHEEEDYSNQGTAGFLWQKFKEHPIPILGVGVTCFFFTRAVMTNKNASSFNRNLRNRVKAQAFTIIAIAFAYQYKLYNEGNKKKPRL